MKAKMAVVFKIDVPPETYLLYLVSFTGFVFIVSGFIYMSPFVHNSLTYSQYVAPLMANFDTKGNNSEILYKEYESWCP